MRLQFTEPRACVVAGCKNVPAAEVHVNKKERSKFFRRWGAQRIYTCAAHETDPEVNKRLGAPLWQELLFAPADGGWHDPGPKQEKTSWWRGKEAENGKKKKRAA